MAISRQRLGSKGIGAKLDSPPPLSEKNKKPQEKKQKDPKVPFMKIRGCSNRFFEELVALRGGTEEESCLKGRRFEKHKRLSPRSRDPD